MGGAAPILVMPDVNGSYAGDSECLGTADDYLVSGIRDFMQRHFGVSTSARSWVIAGASEGGMCAALLALRHPGKFAAFADFAGLAAPTIGPSANRARTVRDLFGGSRQAFDRHDPLWLLAHGPVGATAAWFETGRSDPASLAAQLRLAAAARAAGLPTVARTRSGAHDWLTRAGSFAASLGWMWRHCAHPAPQAFLRSGQGR